MSMKRGLKNVPSYTCVCHVPCAPKSVFLHLFLSRFIRYWMRRNTSKNWFIEPPTHLFLLTAYQKFTPNKMRINENNNYSSTTTANNGQVKKKAEEEKNYDDGGVLKLTKIDINRELSVKKTLCLSFYLSLSVWSTDTRTSTQHDPSSGNA